MIKRLCSKLLYMYTETTTVFVRGSRGETARVAEEAKNHFETGRCSDDDGFSARHSSREYGYHEQFRGFRSILDLNGATHVPLCTGKLHVFAIDFACSTFLKSHRLVMSILQTSRNYVENCQAWYMVVDLDLVYRYSVARVSLHSWRVGHAVLVPALTVHVLPVVPVVHVATYMYV